MSLVRQGLRQGATPALRVPRLTVAVRADENRAEEQAVMLNPSRASANVSGTGIVHAVR